MIHRILRRGFDEAKRLVENKPPRAPERLGAIGGYIGFTLDGLHNHHSSEDELLWPALLERARPSQDLISSDGGAAPPRWRKGRRRCDA